MSFRRVPPHPNADPLIREEFVPLGINKSRLYWEVLCQSEILAESHKKSFICKVAEKVLKCTLKPYMP